MDRRLRIRISALLTAALAVALDQSTKAWALTALRPRPDGHFALPGHLTLPGPLDLTFTLNQSNAFGLTPVIGHATRWLLMSANLAVAAVLLYVILTRPLKPLMLFGLALIMAGALGNALDRLFTGAVIDFLDAGKLGFTWIFNLADATLDAGIALVLLSSLRNERPPTPKQPP
jgi:signal peptidase II